MLAAVVGYHNPSLFLWFDNTCVTWSLVFCMAAMGLTLTFEEIVGVFTRSPQLLLLGACQGYQSGGCGGRPCVLVKQETGRRGKGAPLAVVIEPAHGRSDAVAAVTCQVGRDVMSQDHCSCARAPCVLRPCAQVLLRFY